MNPSQIVRCTKFAATLAASACARRHRARYPSGAGAGYACFEPCAACSWPRRRAASLEAGDYWIPGWRAFDPVDAQKQSRARWIHFASLPLECADENGPLLNDGPEDQSPRMTAAERIAVIREELVRLASSVASKLTTVRPGQHSRDLAEIHGHLLALAARSAR